MKHSSPLRPLQLQRLNHASTPEGEIPATAEAFHIQKPTMAADWMS
jgi:hypothetical protein